MVSGRESADIGRESADVGRESVHPLTEAILEQGGDIPPGGEIPPFFHKS